MLLKTSFSFTEKRMKLLKTTPLITDLGRAGLACLYTVFRWINVLGAEAEYEPLVLSDFSESNHVDSWIP